MEYLPGTTISEQRRRLDSVEVEKRTSMLKPTSSQIRDHANGIYRSSMGPVETIIDWLTRLDLNRACTGSASGGVNGATPPGFASDESDHLEPNVSDRSHKIALYARCVHTEIQ
jgi:hypothetical protein